ncbi:SpoIIE family protein phosphatase [Streptomyces sp. WAC04114]|uniref:SpoIIE family protein phosphatase n=1 Tax=Streptomyces sp. WAC04114 TaxID=2867961 RepID=UPI0035ABE4E9
MRNGEIRVLEPSVPSPPLNLATLLGDDYNVDTVAFASGDQMLLYTDGVTETRDRAGTFFPLPARMRQLGPATPRELPDRLHRDLLHYSGGRLDDDIAAVAVRRPPWAPRDSRVLRVCRWLEAVSRLRLRPVSRRI